MTSKPPPSSSNSPSAPPNDTLSIQRGDYGRPPLAVSLFFTLGRAISAPLQYYIITRHPLQALFPSLPPAPFGTGGPLTISLPTTLAAKLGISATQTFARLPFMCASMPAILTFKQLIWFYFMMRERMNLPFAMVLIPMDLAYECFSSLIFTTASSNPLWSEKLFYSSYTVFTSFVLVELVSELQRHFFKQDPKNQGKVCDRGLWGVVRNVNYMANMVFGWMYGMACGGPLYSVCTAAMYMINLGANAGPSKEMYMKQKYGVEWERYVREVRWKFFPGIW